MAERDNTVSLVISGKAYTGWKSVSIRRALDAIAGTFTVSLSDRWAIDQKPLEIVPEASCVLYVGKDTLITGYIDEIAGTESSKTHEMTISGRDKTKDLVDCSVKDCEYEFVKVPILSVVEAICQPYNLLVNCERSLLNVRVDKFSIQPGERCFEAIDRACRSVGVLPTSNPNGEVVLTRAGSTIQSTDLVYDENVKSYQYRYSTVDRFSTYKVFSQKSGNDNSDPEANAQILGEATDPSISRGRTIMLSGVHGTDRPTADIRAKWEAAVRAGRSGHLVLTVQGWRDNQGAIWDVNKIVDVYVHRWGLNYDPMLISEVELNLSRDSGTTSVITVCRQDAFLCEPLPVKATRAKKNVWEEVGHEVSRNSK
jgi:prophage tail gpP-like protein